MFSSASYPQIRRTHSKIVCPHVRAAISRGRVSAPGSLSIESYPQIDPMHSVSACAHVHSMNFHPAFLVLVRFSSKPIHKFTTCIR